MKDSFPLRINMTLFLSLILWCSSTAPADEKGTQLSPPQSIEDSWRQIEKLKGESNPVDAGLTAFSALQLPGLDYEEMLRFVDCAVEGLSSDVQTSSTHRPIFLRLLRAQSDLNGILGRPVIEIDCRRRLMDFLQMHFPNDIALRGLTASGLCHAASGPF